MIQMPLPNFCIPLDGVGPVCWLSCSKLASFSNHRGLGTGCGVVTPEGTSRISSQIFPEIAPSLAGLEV